MRELKDYFCDYKQSLALKELGYLSDENVLAFYASFYETQTPDLKFEYEDEFDDFDIIQPAPLRSQALDFFRDLGYTFNSYITANDNKFAYDCLNRFGDYFDESFDLPHEPESALISLLIEFEKEARNGNKT